MSLLTQIVAAEDDEAAAIGESLRPLDEWSGIERRGIDTAKIVVMHCLLTGDDFDCAANYYEPVYIGGEGAVVLRLANEATERLATLDEDGLDCLATELAATEDFELEGWPEAEVAEMVLELAELAELAESQGQALFVWMHPPLRVLASEPWPDRSAALRAEWRIKQLSPEAKRAYAARLADANP